MTLSSYRVLIVDDNPTFVKTLSLLVQTVLGNKLSQLDTVSTGEDAIEMVSMNTPYNVIFMDVNMPGIGGVAATKEISKEYYRATRVVAVSFNKDLETMKSMLFSGATYYLHKDDLTLEKLVEIFDF